MRVNVKSRGQKKHKVCLVAVDVRSAHNIGSLFRTCDGFGVELFIVGKSPRPRYDDDTRLPYVVARAEKEIAKTALGAQKTVTWRYADTLLECKTVLQKEGYALFAVEQHPGSRNLTELRVSQNTAVVVGNEVDGMNGVDLSLCEGVYEIPMAGEKESFNVAVTAGIALYQAVNL